MSRRIVADARVALVALGTVAVSACGADTPSVPTTPHSRGVETMSGPAIAPQSSMCWGFSNAKAGPVSADVSPRSIHVVLGAGTCSAPGAILAERDGEVVEVDAPAGSNHVMLVNLSDSPVPYTLRVTHWY